MLLPWHDLQLQQALLVHQCKRGCRRSMCTQRKTLTCQQQKFNCGNTGGIKQDWSATSQSLITGIKSTCRPSYSNSIAAAHLTAPAAEIRRSHSSHHIHAAPIESDQSGSGSISTGSQGMLQVPSGYAPTQKYSQHRRRSGARIGGFQIPSEHFYPVQSTFSRPADKCKTRARRY